MPSSDYWLNMPQGDCATARQHPHDVLFEIIPAPSAEGDSAENSLLQTLNLLFGDQNLLSDSSDLRTFAVLDGAKLPFVLTGMLETSGLRHLSLFQGETQDKIGEYAPYLVEIDRENQLTHKLLRRDSAMGLRERELGIFIRARADFMAMRRHLRKFTRIQNEKGAWFYWRFWEGRALPAPLHAFGPDDRLAFFMGGKLLSFVFVAADMTALRMSLRGNAPQSTNGAVA